MRILKNVGEFIELVILAIFWKVFSFTGKEATGKNIHHGSGMVPAGTVHDQLKRESRVLLSTGYSRDSLRRETWNDLRK